MSDILPITTFGMNVLRKQSETISEINIDVIRLIENMFTTMKNADGIGLAAPQVNHSIALCIVDISVIEEYKLTKPLTLINPVIVDHHNNTTLEEGCLSIPEVRGPVERYDKIFLKYRDLNLNEISLEADGFLSRVIQHEIDHINGILFIDRLNEDDKKKVKNTLNKIKKNKIKTNYPLYLDFNPQ